MKLIPAQIKKSTDLFDTARLVVWHLSELGYRCGISGHMAVILFDPAWIANAPQEVVVSIDTEDFTSVESLIIERDQRFCMDGARFCYFSRAGTSRPMRYRITWRSHLNGDFETIIYCGVPLPVIPFRILLLDRLERWERYNAESIESAKGTGLGRTLPESIIRMAITRRLHPGVVSLVGSGEDDQHLRDLLARFFHSKSADVQALFSPTGLPSEAAQSEDASVGTLGDELGTFPGGPQLLSYISCPRIIPAGLRNIAQVHAAIAAVYILSAQGFAPILFGSVACCLYGHIERLPKDTDIIILSPPAPPDGRTEIDVVTLKRLLVKHDPAHFFFSSSTDPSTPWDFLRYRSNILIWDCKVDIAFSGAPDQPYLSPRRVKEIHGLPVVPFPLLLLQKLKAWDDHRTKVQMFPEKPSAEKHRRKRDQDANDICRMLEMSPHIEELCSNRPWKSQKEIFSEEFLTSSKVRAKRFTSRFYHTKALWRTLGLI